MHSSCSMEEATIALIEEKKKYTAARISRVELEKGDLECYLVNNLKHFSGSDNNISVS